MIRMDTIITKEAVATAVYEAIPHLACELPADILAGLAAALEREEAPRGRAVAASGAPPGHEMASAPTL